MARQSDMRALNPSENQYWSEAMSKVLHRLQDLPRPTLQIPSSINHYQYYHTKHWQDSPLHEQSCNP